MWQSQLRPQGAGCCPITDNRFLFNFRKSGVFLHIPAGLHEKCSWDVQEEAKLRGMGANANPGSSVSSASHNSADSPSGQASRLQLVVAVHSCSSPSGPYHCLCGQICAQWAFSCVQAHLAISDCCMQLFERVIICKPDCFCLTKAPQAAFLVRGGDPSVLAAGLLSLCGTAHCPSCAL